MHEDSKIDAWMIKKNIYKVNGIFFGKISFPGKGDAFLEDF